LLSIFPKATNQTSNFTVNVISLESGLPIILSQHSVATY
jgi:hypothetical protein